jgi:low affinity Fe/Cu permease
MSKHMDRGSFVVALVTLALFVAALFTKGMTHDLFLEAGVFLVSVKIIVMAYRNSVSVARMDAKLDAILAEIRKSKRSDGPPA